MRGRKGSTTQWYCESGCFHKQGHVTRKPCRLCCGYTGDTGVQVLEKAS
jgi:hypothetical protein